MSGPKTYAFNAYAGKEQKQKHLIDITYVSVNFV